METEKTLRIPEEFLKRGAILSSPDGSLYIAYGKGNSHRLYFPDFFLKNEPWICFKHLEKLPLTTLLKTAEFPLSWQTDMTPFHKGFDSAMTLIEQGVLQKAVPYAFSTSNTSMTAALLEHLIHSTLAFCQQNKAFAYGFWNEEEGLIGATPEMLFSYDRGVLKTHAVAGTSKDPEHLKRCPKEQKEHQLVIEGILSALPCLTPKKTTIQPFGSLYHLVTPLEGKTAPPTFETLIKTLHPTPALGTYPKNSPWLKSYAITNPRGRFGAPIGLCSKNAKFAYVGIRGLSWTKNQLKIGAGCGIVSNSNKIKEAEEILHKIDAIKQFLFIKKH
jgi:menaquinone-specific isochorismate synthase